MLLADFIPRLLVDAPECPDETARQAIVATAQDLCKYAFVWDEVQEDPITLIDGLHTYDVEVPDGAQLAVVRGGWVGANPVICKTLPQIAGLMPAWQTEVGTRPLYMTSNPAAATLRVFPIPAEANSAQMFLRVAYAPELSATELDDGLVNEHADLLLQGARSRLFKQPRKPWSDLKLAVAEAALYGVGREDARIRALLGNQPGSLNARDNARPFGF